MKMDMYFMFSKQSGEKRKKCLDLSLAKLSKNLYAHFDKENVYKGGKG